jgi:hypothetical protein
VPERFIVDIRVAMTAIAVFTTGAIFVTAKFSFVKNKVPIGFRNEAPVNLERTTSQFHLLKKNTI